MVLITRLAFQHGLIYLSMGSSQKQSSRQWLGWDYLEENHKSDQQSWFGHNRGGSWDAGLLVTKLGYSLENHPENGMVREQAKGGRQERKASSRVHHESEGLHFIRAFEKFAEFPLQMGACRMYPIAPFLISWGLVQRVALGEWDCSTVVTAPITDELRG